MRKFLAELYRIWVSERPNQLAAALAYYSMFSFAPIIFLLVRGFGFFVREASLGEKFHQRLVGMFGEGIADLVRDSVMAISITPARGSMIISIVSIFVLLLAASGLFYQLQFSLNTIWRVPPPQQGQTVVMIRQRFTSFLIVIAVGLFGVMISFLSVVLFWFKSLLESLLGLADIQVYIVRMVAPVVLGMVLALFYKILPETKVGWKDVWMGAGIATALILFALFLAVFFLRHISLDSALHATGAFSMLLVGFYYIAQIFLFGAVCCRVYAENFGSKHYAPELKPEISP